MIPLLIPVPLVLMIWGATLIVRGVVSMVTASAFLAGWLNSRRLVVIPSTRAQRWSGVIGGPCVMAGAVGLFLYGMYWIDEWRTVEDLFRVTSAWWPAAAVCVMVGIAVIWVGFRLDPAKGRRRCAACWYDYATLASDARCPECGWVARGERDLRRTRRSRGLMMCGVCIVCSAYFVLTIPRLRAMGWKGAIPTSALIFGASWIPDSLLFGSSGGAAPSDGSLVSRLGGQEGMPQWQLTWLKRRATEMMSESRTLESAGRGARLANLVGVYVPSDSPLSAEVLEEAFASLSSMSKGTKTNALGIVQFAAQSEDPRLPALLDEHQEAIASEIKRGGPMSWMLLWAVARRAERADPWFDLIAGMSKAPGATRMNAWISGTLGGMISRLPDARERADRLLESGSDPIRAVMLGALAQSERLRPDPEAVSARAERLRSFFDDRSDLVAAAAFELLHRMIEGEQLEPGPWRGAVLKALRERETERESLVLVVLAFPVDVELAAWVLRDGVSGGGANPPYVTEVLARVRQLPEWREALTTALQQPGIRAAHEAAIRAELARIKNAAGGG